MNPVDSMEQAKEAERQRRRAYMSSKGQRPGAQSSRSTRSARHPAVGAYHQPASAKIDPMEAAKEAERRRRRDSLETNHQQQQYEAIVNTPSPGAFAGMFGRRRGDRQEELIRQHAEIEAKFDKPKIEKDLEHGEELRQGMRAQIEGLTIHYTDLKTTLAVHGDRARARWASDNITGALISLKRVKKAQVQLDQVLEASNYLLTLEVDLLNQLEQVRMAYQNGAFFEDGHSFSQFEDYHNVVQAILEDSTSGLPDDASTDTSDDDNARLLLELAEFSTSTAVGSH